MGSVDVHVSGRDARHILPVLLLTFAVCGLIFPVCADEEGYTQGSLLGAPDWLLERMDTDIMPDSYYPKNITSGEEEKPTVNSYIRNGNNLLVSGSYSDAKNAFENAISLRPESFDAWAGRGMALEGLKRYQTALDSYEKAIGFSNLSKNVWLAYAGKGRVSYHLQDYETASKSLENAIDEFAGSGESNVEDLVYMYEKLADAKEKLGEEDAASDAMKKAAELRVNMGNTFSNVFTPLPPVNATINNSTS